MEYVLENKEEAVRLEFQSTQPNYELSVELQEVFLNPGDKVLDAGCGSGLGIRYLSTHFPQIRGFGCDRSHQRIDQAREFAKAKEQENLEFFVSDLECISAESESFDFVFCRFVLEHLKSPQIAANEFFRILSPGGRVCVVDLDGILFNIYSSNQELRELLQELKGSWESDLFVGRKIPVLLQNSGFKNIKWRPIMMDFGDVTKRQVEIQLTKTRLEFIKSSLISIYGSEKRAERFIRLYVSELNNESTTLFYTKFIVEAQKPSFSI